MRVRVVVFLVVLAGACATYAPKPLEQVDLRARAQSRTDDDVTVTVAVLSAEEAHEVFGVKLYKQKIQPVWVEIQNKSDKPWMLIPAVMDPDYFSPLEAAWKSHWTWRGSTNRHMSEVFYQRALGPGVKPGATRSGFVFTNLDLGAKFINLALATRGEWKRFEFLFQVPGLKTDMQDVDFKTIYKPGEIVDYDDLSKLRKAIASLPRAVKDKAGKAEGDPVNFVLVGDGMDILAALVRRNWHMTETVYGGSAWKTSVSFLFGSKYKYSPVSPLYVFGRAQDVALQKARGSVHQRNHLRLWLAPMRWQNKPVWAGQISRDIGVTTSKRTLITHKIDPDVDETRLGLVQDLLLADALARLGYTKGVGAAVFPISMRKNLGNDPYFTDGLRAVLFVSENVPFEELDFLDWEQPYRD